MRIVKTDRGYVDMDHVLAVGEPHDFMQGMYKFDVTFILRDAPMEFRYDSHELGVTSDVYSEKWYEDMATAMLPKRDAFVSLWKGEVE